MSSFAGGPSIRLSKQLQKLPVNRLLSFSSVSCSEEGQEARIRAGLADACRTTYIRGRWVFTDSLGELQHCIVGPTLPGSGDYSAYNDWSKFPFCAESFVNFYCEVNEQVHCRAHSWNFLPIVFNPCLIFHYIRGFKTRMLGQSRLGLAPHNARMSRSLMPLTSG